MEDRYYKIIERIDDNAIRVRRVHQNGDDYEMRLVVTESGSTGGTEETAIDEFDVTEDLAKNSGYILLLGDTGATQSGGMDPPNEEVGEKKGSCWR